MLITDPVLFSLQQHTTKHLNTKQEKVCHLNARYRMFAVQIPNVLVWFSDNSGFWVFGFWTLTVIYIFTAGAITTVQPNYGTCCRKWISCSLIFGISEI